MKYGTYPYQLAEDLIVLSLLRGGDIVIDVGANIGYYALVAARCLGKLGGGIVYAFEPGQSAFAALQQMAKQQPGIVPEEIALSNVDGEHLFTEEQSSNLSHLASSDADANCGYFVKVRRLDDWFLQHAVAKLDLLKIDTEGNDYNVLCGAVDCIRRFSPIIEFEAFQLEEVAKVHTLLINEDNSYKIYRVYNDYPTSLLQLQKPHATHNYFAIPQSRRGRLPEFLFGLGFLREQ